MFSPCLLTTACFSSSARCFLFFGKKQRAREQGAECEKREQGAESERKRAKEQEGDEETR
jgi:collagenase-like PrtC family protease